MIEPGFVDCSGAGSLLNIKVVGGTEQPATPKENMIWVCTADKITSWAFSAAEPEAASEGMVWIRTGTDSAVFLEALKDKKKSITVYIVGTYQYKSGAWVYCDGAVYKNGGWASLKYWLIRNGKVNANTVGSFTYTSGGYGNTSVAYNGDHIYMSNGHKSTCNLTSKNLIASSKYSTLYIEMEYYNANYSGVWFYAKTGSAGISRNTDLSRQTLALDISGVTSDNTFILEINQGNVDKTFYAKVYNAWLE